MPTDTKTALLMTAERAARTRGFDGFCYADLAESVGIRKASVHHHFPTKAALSVALMHRYHADKEAACARVDAAETTGGARLLGLINLYNEALDGGKSLCLCVSFSTSRESLPSEVTAQIGRFRMMMIGWLKATFEVGRSDGTIAAVEDPAAEAAATLPLLEGAQLAARAAENPAIFECGLKLLRQRLT